ncbi:SMC-Scp complex subunit ScpB [Tianweitania sediminis]|uniref:SMC-Scp complex subunit ScpB n=1 Tax=Tianweitania sediminis TaxID=1502156 RepID=A0A8J7QZR7_9HYPH|nr:SMC-Scp complex subunit ScpB [Tianweitania sediminis]MBP0439808.1 SMC-Scp complex subunit ScpB [Tianweitania sediminis]
MADPLPFPTSTDAGVEQQRLFEAVRVLEALLFASAEPVTHVALQEHLPAGVAFAAAIAELGKLYATRGVNLVRVGEAWAFRTAPDLAHLLQREASQQKKLSRAALEVLATIAYHQPVTRAEIEDVRGVETSKGTLDLLLESNWIRMRGRRRTPGRPVTYGTTAEFLDHFGLADIGDLPGMEELKGAGLLSTRLPQNFSIPSPANDGEEPAEDEDAFTPQDLEELGLLPPGGTQE